MQPHSQDQANGFTGAQGGNSATVGQSGDRKEASSYQYSSGNTSDLAIVQYSSYELRPKTNRQSDVNATVKAVVGTHSVDGAASFAANQKGANVLQDESVGNYGGIT